MLKLLQYIFLSQTARKQICHQRDPVLGNLCTAPQSQTHFLPSRLCVHLDHFQHSSRDLHKNNVSCSTHAVVCTIYIHVSVHYVCLCVMQLQ